jgi:hypothetical protein
MKVKKIHSAKNQLETAINLYFEDKDLISTHSLASAAHVVLSNLAAKVDMPHWFRNEKMILKFYPSLNLKQYFESISAPQNFFKHADKPTEKIDNEIEFSPQLTELFILDSVQIYQNLAHDITINMAYYRFWFLIQHPDTYDLNKEWDTAIVSLKEQKLTKQMFMEFIKKPETQPMLELLKVNSLKLLTTE